MVQRKTTTLLKAKLKLPQQMKNVQLILNHEELVLTSLLTGSVHHLTKISGQPYLTCHLMIFQLPAELSSTSLVILNEEFLLIHSFLSVRSICSEPKSLVLHLVLLLSLKVCLNLMKTTQL
jgi:hypothetical protein